MHLNLQWNKLIIHCAITRYVLLGGLGSRWDLFIIPYSQILPPLDQFFGLLQSAPNHKLYIMTPNSQNYLKDFRFWFIIASFIIIWVMILRAYPIG